jgi:Putative Flp pilus-assembly TadE/G-like
MPRVERVRRNEQGAVFVQVGIVIVALMAFNVFVLDYGVLWIARGQAQNAADAGALAGAVARGYDDFANPPHPVDSDAARIARSVAQANAVWREPATAVVSFDCPAGVTGRCTRVDVYRDGNNGSEALDAFFGPILGIMEQGVRATATAVTGNGNTTPCLRPWALADDWVEDGDTAPLEFNYYDAAGTPLPAAARDEYLPPSASAAGLTTVSADFGERIVWQFAHPLDPTIPITRELVVPLNLPGGRTFAANMADCVGEPIALHQTLRVLDGIHPSEIDTATASLFAQDPSADYDYPNLRITGSCAPDCGSVTPRLMAVALYDPRRFQLGRATNNWTQPEVGCPTNHPCIRVTNIIGLFLHRMTPAFGYGPHGHFMRYPGVTAATAPTFVDDGSWLVTTHLIR